MPKTHAEVIEAVSWLENDYRAGGLIAENTANERTYQLNDVHKFNDDLTRGTTIIFPVPRMSEWVRNVVNQVLPYQTFPVVTPLGGGLTPSEADKLEAAVALILAEILEGGTLTSEAYRAFMRNSHVIYQVVPGKMEDSIPASVVLPDIKTCFFERFKGGRPPMLARSYKLLVREAEARYSGKKGEHDGNGKQATWDKATGRMRYGALSVEMPANGEGGTWPTAKAGLGELLEVKEFYDDDYSCHLIKGSNDSDWQEVLRQPSVTNGVPFFIVPSNPEGGGTWVEDWRPIGWPLYTHKKQIERMESEQQTRGEQAQQHFIARMPPADVEAAQKLRDGGYAITFNSGPNAVPIAAEEIVQLETMSNEGLETRIVRHSQDMERWIASWLLPASEEVIKSANVGSYQIGAKAVHAQESGLLSNHTRGLAGAVEMIVHMMANKYLGNREIYAKDETTYGRMGAHKVEPGKAISLSAELLKKVKVYGPDANVRVEVVTRSETESELEQREAGVWANVQRGSQTFDEFIAVRNPDVTGQHEALAKDAVRKALATVYDAAQMPIAAKRNLERFGIDVDRLMQTAMAPPVTEGAPAGTGRQGQPMPVTGGADISSFGGAQPAGATRG